MKERIFITGVSGVGKTTLAKWIAEEYGLEYISTSASKLWPQFGFKNHADALKKSMINPILGYQYQMAIYQERVKALAYKDSFVTDRSPIDNLVYFLLQQGYYNEHDTLEMIDFCRKSYVEFQGKTFHLQIPEGFSVEDNGRRIVNLPYQKLVESVMNSIISEYFNGPEIWAIKSWYFEVKKLQVTLALNSDTSHLNISR